MLFSRSLKLAVLGCALTLPALLGGCDRQSRENAQPQPSASSTTGSTVPLGTVDRAHKGSKLPDFTLSDGQGHTLRLQDLKGEPLLINLWATWCAPCVTELPQLNKLAARDGRKLKVLAVSQDMQPGKVASFLKQHGIRNLHPWLDPNNDLSFHYGTGNLPTTVLYDAKGREVWRLVGGHDWSSPETARLLAEGMKG